jgi:protein gp37
MSTTTGIEWTDATWNPVVGCSIVSPGCKNCYAMRMAGRIEAMDKAAGHAPHYRGLTRPSKAGAVWTGAVRLHRPALLAPLSWRKPRRAFVNSMSDLFHEALSDADIDQVFAVMASTPHCVFQILTKRADRMRDYTTNGQAAARRISRAVPTTLIKWPLPNVWLGVSAERQVEADARVPDLLATPAARRFVSAEPLLGPIDLRHVAPTDSGYINALSSSTGPNLDWLIVGGESGPGARPMHPQWTRDLRDQCAAARVPFFFKQWGTWSAVYDRDQDDPDWRRCDVVARQTERRGGQWLNLAGGQGFHGERVVRVVRTSKAAAGAELDGRLHREFPT